MINDMTRREYEISTAYSVGMNVPRIQYLGDKTLTEIEQISLDKQWDVVDSIAIERLEGIDCSFVAFYNGEDFLYNTVVVNDKKLLTGNQGIELPANIVTAFPGKSKKISSIMKKLSEKFLEAEDFTGFVTLDVVFKEDKLYYERIRFSILYDYLHAISSLSNMDVESLLAVMESGEKLGKPEGYGCSLRLYEYPYGTNNKNAAYPYIEEYNLKETEDCYVVTGSGKTIKKTWKDLYRKIKDVDMCYRLDGDYKARWTVAKLKQGKYV